MKYSIIIPTYNKCDELLKPCIESILAYTTVNTPDHAEIIVVANGCTDNTVGYINSLHEKFHNIHLIRREEAIGYTKATNLGMERAKGEYMVVLNNDTILLNQNYNEWLEILVRPFETISAKVGITGPMKVPNDSTQRPFIIFFCAMISRELYNTIGPLDEIFSPGYGEDTDYCLRAEAAGFLCEQVPVTSTQYYDHKKMTGYFPIYHAGNKTFGDKENQDEELIHRNNKILLDRYGKLNEPDPEDFREFMTVPKVPLNIYKAQQCDGYMADEELMWLASQAYNKVIVEVGSWHGKSSRALADNIGDGTLYCVDHWLGSEIERNTNHSSASLEDGDHAFMEFCDNTFDLIKGGAIIPIRMHSKNAAKLLANKAIEADMIFIDAGHTKQEVSDDIQAWLPVLAPGGMICGHDMFHVNNSWPGVGEAVREKFSGMVEQAPNTSIWVVRGVEKVMPEEKIHWYREPCVFDCFPFNNELDILEKRFETLYSTVDRFVIVEAKFTHAGQPKELVLHANLDRFGKYLDKVTYLVIESFPDYQGTVTDKSWARERYQREWIMHGLGNCNDDDIIIISDCDEIPDPYAIMGFKEGFPKGQLTEISIFDMNLFYYDKHTLAKDKWREAKITTYRKLRELGPCGIRYTQSGSLIENGGEHLSYFGGVDKIVQKIKDTAHQEYNLPEYLDPVKIAERVDKGEDVFGRDNVIFEQL